MKFIKSIFTFTILMFSLGALVSCEEDVTGDVSLANFVGLEEMISVNIEEGADATVQARILASDRVSTDRTFNLIVEAGTTAGAANYTVPATVTIPANSLEGVFEVYYSGADLGDGKKIVIGLDATGHNVAADPTYDSTNVITGIATKKLTINFVKFCPLNPLRIEIVTDAYGSETTWELYDSALNIVATGGPYADGNQAIGYPQTPVNLCLEDGNYTFIIYDSYNDGMNSGVGEGYYRLVKTTADGEEVEIAKNGTFGSDEIVEFSLP